jgi:hypothetical protein
VAGGDLDTGAANHVREARSKEVTAAFGLYFDNDTGRFSSPHPAALDLQKPQKIFRVIEATLAAKVLTA